LEERLESVMKGPAPNVLDAAMSQTQRGKTALHLKHSHRAEGSHRGIGSAAPARDPLCLIHLLSW
jgi:hypothetical protein